jgi:hypothetical protein
VPTFWAPPLVMLLATKKRNLNPNFGKQGVGACGPGADRRRACRLETILFAEVSRFLYRGKCEWEQCILDSKAAGQPVGHRFRPYRSGLSSGLRLISDAMGPCDQWLAQSTCTYTNRLNQHALIPISINMHLYQSQSTCTYADSCLCACSLRRCISPNFHTSVSHRIA